MPAGFETNNSIDFGSIVMEAAFVDYVNAYIEEVQKKGAAVCLSYCPMNSLAIDSAEDDIRSDYVDYLSSSFQCPIISEIDHYIFESSYFYDTNFHLNDRGSYFRTKQLATDLAEYFDLAYVDVEPPITEDENRTDDHEAEVVVDDSAFVDCFTYEDFYGVGLAVTGVTEIAKEYTELAIPQEYDGHKVVAIMSGAFSGCDQLTQIRISRTSDDSIVINNGAFSGAENLRSVILDAEPTSVSINTQGLLQDAPNDLLFYVEKSLYAKYVTDYYWSVYSEAIKIWK
jgi:hypothetical protein